jgi:SAM-dependent methyltransferase
MNSEYTSDPLFESVSVPAVIDGFPSFAPEQALDGNGFRSDFHANIAALEEGNFWFVGRNRFILWALKKYCPDFDSFLEIGCGTGFVLSAISRDFLQAKLYGSELFCSGLTFAAERIPSATFMQMDARSLPFESQLDVVGAFDVLEHIREDRDVLDQIRKSLKPGGVLIATVPQHPWLWSGVDDYSCHVRRYERSELQSKIKDAGFSILRTTSFVTSLLPAMAASRLVSNAKRSEKYDASGELKINSTLNAIFKGCLSAELRVVRMGVDLPVGGSRLVVARKA